MHLTTLVTAALAGTAIAGRSLAHVRKDNSKIEKRAPPAPRAKSQASPIHRRNVNETIIPQNANTTKFAVNGTALPFVDFDIGESYAG